MLAGISRVKDEYRRISGKNYCLQSVPITHNKINADRDIFENVIVWTRVVMNSALCLLRESEIMCSVEWKVRVLVRDFLSGL